MAALHGGPPAGEIFRNWGNGNTIRLCGGVVAISVVENSKETSRFRPDAISVAAAVVPSCLPARQNERERAGSAPVISMIFRI
ncbi:MAG TPA: hypothetical protein DDZ83_16430 [Nitrospinae bacterium]|nr:hypothetical protein [Nitrospinota bacterium]